MRDQGQGRWEQKRTGRWVGLAHTSEGYDFILCESGVTAGCEETPSSVEHHDSLVILGG